MASIRPIKVIYVSNSDTVRAEVEDKKLQGRMDNIRIKMEEETADKTEVEE